ncbi:MAG: four helix bundle protein [Candidatus Cloacimonetes bacterium]|jgi:four helix bundle protein|nr:four helix bundle protein [Candidatus Cloacimonadota bacterium]MBT5419911.1 four helix bundle protein [Candidatus Cloacimonadota bacterium]
MKSYRDLDIYKLSYELALKVHKVTMTLPKYEIYEEGSQVRRSSKSIPANIVEGYGRKKYKADFIKFLIYSHSSCDETILHLNLISDTHNIENIGMLITSYNTLGCKINTFIKYVENNWK